MKDLKDISPETEEAHQSDVLILPTEYFFCECVEVPSNINTSELADFAELSIEGISPFPLEQLRWGFVTSVDGKSVFIYAALNERLKLAGYTELEGYNWVLPDFSAFKDTELFDVKKIIQQGEASLWQADVRPTYFKSIERKNRSISAWLTRLMGYAAFFILFLISLEGLLIAGSTWLGTRQAKVNSQRPQISRIEDKHSLMNKLEQVAQNELRPIAILEAANQVRIGLENSGIEYDEVFIEGVNRLVIEGKANTINELNDYTKALKNSGNFHLVETPESITRSGKTTFIVTLDYLQTNTSKMIGGDSG
ncbi:MAG: hypothetical protein VXU48_03045 [Verrucomicrobiota bacterium]|nr:hypothetical protein [Verrucomicrobiota bacterium]